MSKTKRLILLSCSCLGVAFAAPAAFALPEYNSTVAGSVALDHAAPNTLNIHQHSSKAIVQWNKFNIGSAETVNIMQPGSNSILLNRVLDSDPSKILGNLNANGHVWIMNPGGVLFGENANVNVGGLIATTANIDNDDFLSGNYKFDQAGLAGGTIINKGTINAGVVGLFASHVSNEGTIRANFGKVVMASTETFTVDFYGDGMLNIALDDLDEDTAQSDSYKVSNAGHVIADAGQIEMTVAQGNAVVERLVEQKWTGTLQANSVGMNKEGKIVLGGEDTTTLVGGNISAQGLNAGEKGGTVKILGDQVAVLNGATVDASGAEGGGTVHVGGEYLGGGDTYRAKAAVVQADATIKANGGDGEVIIWSDEYTNFAGTIEANGGGGFVETSSKDILSATGRVYVTGGEWLLDPSDITIQNDAGGGPDDTDVLGNPIFDGGGGGSIVTTEAIEAALAGANVTIRTDTGGGGNGDIFVNDDIDYTGAAERTLTLEAYRHIEIVGADITSTIGELNVMLNSRYTGASVTGYIYLDNAKIDTNGGDLIMAGGVGAAGRAVGSGNGDGYDGIEIVESDIDTGIGSITMRGQSGGDTGASGISIWDNATVDTTSGSINLDGLGTAGNDNMYGVDLETAFITTQTGQINITGQGGASGDNEAFGVFIRTGTVIASTGAGAGSINITGTAGTASNGAAAGIWIYDSEIDSNSASIDIEGYGNTSGGDYNYGFIMEGNSSVHTVSGNIDVYGEGGAGVNNNHGIALDGPGAVTEIYSTSGNISLEGVGGGGTAAGISVTNDARIYTTTAAAGFGNIELDGTGGLTGASSAGVYFNNAGGVYVNQLETDAGNITVTGQGGAGGQHESGVWMNDYVSVASGSGDISITGTAGTGTNDVHGIFLFNVFLTTASGDIDLTGSTTDNNSYGVYLGAGSRVLSTAAATGDIAFTAISSSFTDFRTSGVDPTYIGDMTAIDSLKNITINADEVEMANTVIDTLGSVVFNTRTQNQDINLGGSTGGLDLSDAELAFISNNVSRLIFTTTTDGNFQTGFIDVDSWNLAGKTFDLELHGGEIDIDGITNAVNMSMFFESTNSVNGSTDIDGLSLINNDATDRSFTIEATDNINVRNLTVDASTGTGQVDVTFNGTDSDADDLSAIFVDNTIIHTKGGDFVMGGGVNPLTGAAMGGIGFFNTTVTTESGNISARGHNKASGGNFENGTRIGGPTTIFETTTGDIEIIGIAESSGTDNNGVWLEGTTVETVSGSINIEGTSAADNTNNRGVLAFVDTHFIQTGVGAVGDITITGTTGGTTARAVQLSDDASITLADANLSITGINSDVYIDADLVKNAGGAADFIVDADRDVIFEDQNAAGIELISTSGAWNVAFNADADGNNTGSAQIIGTEVDTNGGTLMLTGADLTLTSSTIDTGAADITIAASTAARTVGVSGGAGDFGISDAELAMLNTTGSLIIGDSAASTGLVDVDSWDFSGEAYDVEIHGGSLDIDGITAGANLLTLNARTGFVNVTQDVIDFVSATVTAATNIIFNADSNNDGDGYISLVDSTLTTTAGDVYLVGGADGNADDIADGEAAGNATTAAGVTLDNTDITTGNGDVILRGRGYDAAGGSGYGVHLANNTDIDSGDGSVTITGYGGNLGADNFGLYIQNGTTSIISADGDITLTGNGGDSASGSNKGIVLQGVIESETGDIELRGTADGVGALNNGIDLDGSRIESTGSTKATAGTISLYGIASLDGTSFNNIGIDFGNSAQIITDAGNIFLDGEGGAGTTNNWGISFDGSSVIRSDGTGVDAGDITIEASSTAATTGNTNYALYIEGGSTDIYTVAGNIAITATAANNVGGNSNHALYMDRGEIYTDTGTIEINATTTSAGASSNGINMFQGGDIYTTGAGGDITITAQSTNGTDFVTTSANTEIGTVNTDGNITINADEIDMTDTSVNTTANIVFNADTDGDNAGYIALTDSSVTTTTGYVYFVGGDDDGANGGTAADGIADNFAWGNATSGHGVTLDNSDINTGAGSLVMRGHGTTGSSGIRMLGGSDILSGTGTIDLTGVGGNTGGGAHGIYVTTGTIMTTGAGGAITLDGTSGTGATSRAIWLNGGAVETQNNGDITITADARNASAGDRNSGLRMENTSSIEASGTGNIDIDAFGGGGNVESTATTILSNSYITVAAGNIDITSTGAAGNGLSAGMYLGGGTSVYAGNSGDITIAAQGGTGAGGFNAGIFLEGGNIYTDDGDLLVTATAGDNADSYGFQIDSGGLYTTGNGNMTLNAISATDDDFVANNATIGDGSAGNITINADEMTLSGTTSIDTTDIVTITPRTAAQAISLGDALGGLNLSSAELAMISTNVQTLVIGSSTAGTGAVSIDNVDVSAGGYDLEVHGGEITVDNGLTGGGAVFLNARDNSDIIVNDMITAAGAGNSLVLNATGNFINNLGIGALDPGAGRFVVYSADFDTVVDGGLSGDEIFDETYATLAPAAVPGVNDTFVFATAAIVPPPPPPPVPGPDPAPDVAPVTIPEEDLADIITEIEGSYNPIAAVDSNFIELLSIIEDYDFGDTDFTGGWFGDISQSGVSYSFANLLENTAALFNSSGFSTINTSYIPKVGDYIKTGSEFGFSFETDDSAIIKMTRNSEMKVQKMFFSPDGKSTEYYDIKDGAVGFYSGKDQHKGEIKTILPGIAIKVTGTCYIVDHDATSSVTNITLFGGGVELYVKGQLIKLKDPIQMISFGAEGPGSSGPVVPKSLSIGDVRNTYKQKPEIIPSREQLIKCGVPEKSV